MRLVLDASMALAWLFKREKKIELETAQQALLALSNMQVMVPSLWHVEISNALLMGERRKIITEAQTIDYLNRLHLLPISTDDKSVTHCCSVAISLAREYGLTAYDAVYLELALRTDSSIATFDKKLVEAMNCAGGKVFHAN